MAEYKVIAELSGPETTGITDARELLARLPDYPVGHDRLLMRKRL